jgi:hypothetical protein
MPGPGAGGTLSDRLRRKIVERRGRRGDGRERLIQSTAIEGRPGLLQMREEPDPDLADDEGEPDDQEPEQGDPKIDLGQCAHTIQSGAQRCHRDQPQHRHRGEQIHPEQPGCTRLLPGETQCEQGEQTPGPAPETSDPECQDQHQEEVEQGPATHPAIGPVIHATHHQEIPAGRQLQIGVDRLEVERPSRGRKLARRRLDPAIGDQVQITLADLDPRARRGRMILGETGDEHRTPLDPHLSEHEPGPRVQTPATRELTADPIL